MVHCSKAHFFKFSSKPEIITTGSFRSWNFWR